ncbi:MAG TPA: translation elongation factor 4 [Candidatus Paceibacterota bacterium]|nr:translation elongation factor 4 [Candidatus Paceibacterota bacterium]
MIESKNQFSNGVKPEHIRNFSIIAHVDHGKSTLADRLLERTGTIPERLMRDQFLDRMDLERERGITIKMQPVRMRYGDYVLNLIDTPGHIDFSYEVSRALHAVEGVLLLVDSTQGVQAQTLTTLNAAVAQKCTIIPVVSKIDAPAARVEEVSREIAELVHVPVDQVIAVSGRTGQGVPELLEAIIARVPPPSVATGDEPRGLIFDFSYTAHRGIAVYLRVFDGTFKKGQQLTFRAAGKDFTALETGIFTPGETPSDSLSAGEIGYIVTGIKEPGIVGVGDTIGLSKGALPALHGYEKPRPVVWASVYPESQDDLPLLRKALERLRLSDSSLSFEEESSGVLGRGFRCGFLGLLHLEIITERLRREFALSLVVTIPTISYAVTTKNGGREVIYTPSKFPDYGDITQIEEPWAKVIIITPPDTMSSLVQLLYDHEATTLSTETHADGRIEMTVEMPLRELMRGFFDALKNISSGYASLSYELLPERPADVVRLDILVAEEPVPAFARVVSRRRVQEEADKMVEKLHGILPKQLFVTKIQAEALGRIIASRTLSAMRKDVTGYLYGGDVTRKKKLLEKQKRGKQKLLERGTGKVNIPEDVFMKMVQSSAE